jgi:hypothetical protein
MDTDFFDADFAGYAEGFYRSILVYAYILMYCFKNQGFLNEGFDRKRRIPRGKREMDSRLRGNDNKEKSDPPDKSVFASAFAEAMADKCATSDRPAGFRIETYWAPDNDVLGSSLRGYSLCYEGRGWETKVNRNNEIAGGIVRFNWGGTGSLRA